MKYIKALWARFCRRYSEQIGFAKTCLMFTIGVPLVIVIFPFTAPVCAAAGLSAIALDEGRVNPIYVRIILLIAAGLLAFGYVSAIYWLFW